jgi:hypothetical protein
MEAPTSPASKSNIPELADQLGLVTANLAARFGTTGQTHSHTVLLVEDNVINLKVIPPWFPPIRPQTNDLAASGQMDAETRH